MLEVLWTRRPVDSDRESDSLAYGFSGLGGILKGMGPKFGTFLQPLSLLAPRRGNEELKLQISRERISTGEVSNISLKIAGIL